jgi:type I restriction enzyme, R subunit
MIEGATIWKATTLSTWAADPLHFSGVPDSPEKRARQNIDAALITAGWVIQDARAANIHAGRGVAVREFPLERGHGYADYVLYVDGKAAGVIEAKKEGATLTGVEVQAEKYSHGMPSALPAWIRPLPFLYQSTGVETRFTNRLDPQPRSRRVFHFHKPETFAEWLTAPQQSDGTPFTLRSRLHQMPPLVEEGLRAVQIRAVTRLEESFRKDHPRALIQMATGSGKTFTAVTASYRLLKHAQAKRVLFLVDRNNLGKQALGEFHQYVAPDDGRKFGALYNIQHLTSNRLASLPQVTITTIQRLYSMLRGEELDPEEEEASAFGGGAFVPKAPMPVAYNPAIPIEFFDFIFVDEAHRSIYSVWRQVLEYFDAFLIGLTATPSKQTFGFFNQNLVMEYGHRQAVADRVNVDFDVYRVQTKITSQGSTVEAGPLELIGRRDRLTRRMRWEQLDEDFTYDPEALDRTVVAEDQIRTVVRAFRDHLFTDIFPGRTEVPKTLIYAKDDSHADDIVHIIREQFGKGNDFCQKITYKTGTVKVVEKAISPEGVEIEVVKFRSSNIKPEDLLSAFRISYNPRIVVTVDMIATGTDIRPLEIVMFMRAVKSRNFFEQMKGRGVRVINADDLKGVTPDATIKDRFVIVDCVGVTEHELSDTHPIDRHPTVSLEKLLKQVGFGNRDEDVLSSIASRLRRLELRLGEPEVRELATLAGGLRIGEIADGILDALDADKQIEMARQQAGLRPDQEPTAEQVAAATTRMLDAAAQPLATNPSLRERLLDMKKSLEQSYDKTSKDEVLEAGYSAAAKARAKEITTSFEQFIREHKDEITALQILYDQPYGKGLQFADIKALADTIHLPPRSWTPETLWRAYETLEKDRVRGAGKQRLLTDLVSLVRFALRQEDALVPFEDKVQQRFQNWLAEQENRGRRFSGEQLQWLELIRDHVAASMAIDADDFDFPPFAQRGGLGRAAQVFGTELNALIGELNEVLAA